MDKFNSLPSKKRQPIPAKQNDLYADEQEELKLPRVQSMPKFEF